MILPRLVQRLKRHRNRALEMIQSTGELRVASPLLQVDARGAMQRRLAIRFIPAQPATAGAGTLSSAPPPESSPSFGWTPASYVASPPPSDPGFLTASPVGNVLTPSTGTPIGGYEAPASARMPAPLQSPSPAYSESYPPGALFTPPSAPIAAPIAAPRARELPGYPASPGQNVPDGEAPAARRVSPAPLPSALTASPAAAPGAPASALPGPAARPAPAPAAPKGSPQEWAQRLRRHALAELGIFEPLPPPPAPPEPVRPPAPMAPAVASVRTPPPHSTRTAPSERPTQPTFEPSSSVSPFVSVTEPAGSELAPSQAWDVPASPSEMPSAPPSRGPAQHDAPAAHAHARVTAENPAMEPVSLRAAPPTMSTETTPSGAGAPEPVTPIEMRVARRPAHLQRPAPAPRAVEAPPATAAAPATPAQGESQPVGIPTSSSTATSAALPLSSAPLPSAGTSEALSRLASAETLEARSNEPGPDVAPLSSEAAAPTPTSWAELGRRLFASTPAQPETDTSTSAAPAEAQRDVSPASPTLSVEQASAPAPQRDVSPASPTASLERASAPAPQRSAATQEHPAGPEPRTAPVEQRSASAGNRPAQSDRSPQSWLERIKNSIRAEEARLAAQRQGPIAPRLPQAPAMPDVTTAARPAPLAGAASTMPERSTASPAVQPTPGPSSSRTPARVLAAEPSAYSDATPNVVPSAPSATLAAFLAGAPRPFAAPPPQAVSGETTSRPVIGRSSVQAAAGLPVDPRGLMARSPLPGVFTQGADATSRVQLSEATRRSLGLLVTSPGMPTLSAEPFQQLPARSEGVHVAGTVPEAVLNPSVTAPTADAPPSAFAPSPALTAAPLLSPELRLQLEQLTGVDPWTVPIIAGAEGAAMAAAYGAEAVSVHGAVYIGIQESLNSPRGLSLLAHELTHVARARQAERQAATAVSPALVPSSAGEIATGPRPAGLLRATPAFLPASASSAAAAGRLEGVTSSVLPEFLSNPSVFPASTPSAPVQTAWSGGEAATPATASRGVVSLPPVEQDPVEEGFARRSEQLARRLAERTARRTQRAPLVGVEGERLFLPGQAGALVGAPALSPEALAWLEDEGVSSADGTSSGAWPSNVSGGEWSRGEPLSVPQVGAVSEPETGPAALSGTGLLSRTARQQDAWGFLPAPWEPLPTWVTASSPVSTVEVSQAGIRSLGRAEQSKGGSSAAPVPAMAGEWASAAQSGAGSFSSPTGAGATLSAVPSATSGSAGGGLGASTGMSGSASAGVARLAEPATQEADSGGGEPAASSASPPEGAGGAEPNLDAVARQVYERIKRRLQQEVRRSR